MQMASYLGLGFRNAQKSPLSFVVLCSRGTSWRCPNSENLVLMTWIKTVELIPIEWVIVHFCLA